MPETEKIHWKRLALEATAIVVSILLAFAIDAWWDDRNEAQLERRMLSALLVEFEQNAELLREARTEYERYYIDALRVLEYLDNGQDSFDQLDFAKSFSGMLLAGSIHLESGTYDGLLASGGLSFIRDDELRGRLAAWPSYVREWTEEEESVFSYVRSRMDPYLANSIQLRKITRPFADFPHGESPARMPRGDADIDEIVAISASVGFENLVYLKAQGLWYALRDGETLLAQATEISELIRRNLEH